MKQPLHEAELEAILTDPQPESVNSCPDDFPFQGVQDTLTCPACLWGCTLLLAWGVYLPSAARRVPIDCSAAFSLKYMHTCVPTTGKSDHFSHPPTAAEGIRAVPMRFRVFSNWKILVGPVK